MAAKAAVNALEVEPIWKTVSVVTGSEPPAVFTPKPFAKTIVLVLILATALPWTFLACRAFSAYL